MSSIGVEQSYKNVVLYNKINELQFEKTFDEKWREVLFKDLTPCTTYLFKIEAVYKVPDDNGMESKEIYSRPSTLAAETLCPSLTTDNEEDTTEMNYSGSGEDDATTEVYVSTTTPPPIQPISDVETQQTVQVRTA